MTQQVNENELIERICWCGSNSATHLGDFHLDDGGTFQLVQCTNCGVQAIHPQPDDATLIGYYSRDYYGSSRRKFIRPIAAVVELFQSHRAAMTARYVPPNGRLLDVGCGNGEFLVRMNRRGFQVEGTELTDTSASRVPAASNIKVHVGDLISLDLPHHSYDMITIWHVLEHVRDPKATLEKVAALLKPNGRVMIAVPNVESPQARKFGLHWLHYDPPRHLFNLGSESLTRLLRTTGFELEWMTTHSAEQNTFGYIQSWLNARGQPRDRLYNVLKGLDQHGSPAAKKFDMLWMLALLAPAAVISWFQAMCGNGATVIACARISNLK